METGSGQTAPASARARLALAGGLAAVLTAVVLIVVLLGGEDEGPPSEPADRECIEEWNSDRNVVVQGVHQYSAHQYTSVQVLRIVPDGSPLPEEPDEGSAEEQGGEILGTGKGQCTIAFASGALDTEAAAAALTNNGLRWVPVSELPAVDSGRLADLQAEALERANADLQPDGTLSPK